MFGKTFLTPVRTCLVILFAINIFIYSGSADGLYVLDDFANLFNNGNLVIKEFNIESIKNAAFSSPSSRFHRPVSMLSFAANYTLAGSMDPFSAKITNIYLHVLVGLGIYLLTINLLPLLLEFRSAGERNKITELTALLTTAIWLFHPLFVSTVLYTVQRMAILSALFVIYGSLFYIRLRIKTLETNKGHILLFLSTTSFTALAFFSKENGALLPVFLLLIEFFCFRFRFHNQTDRRIKYLLRFFLLAPTIFIFSYLLYNYIQNFNLEPPPYYISSNDRLLTETRVLWRYIGWLIFVNPESMGIFHDDIEISHGLFTPLTTLFSVSAWIAVIAVSCLYLRTRNIFVFPVLWFLIGHSVESTTLLLMPVFEHRNYLPGYGLLLGFSIFFVKFINRKDSHIFFKYVFLSIFFLVIPAGLSIERINHWSDPKSFALFQLENNPESHYSLLEAALYLSNSGDYDNALLAIRHAADLHSEESAYILAEAYIHCRNKPDKKFDASLPYRLINETDFNRRTLYFQRQFEILTMLCAPSIINYEVLLEFYDIASTVDDFHIKFLANYHRGMIYMKLKRYPEAINALEWVQARVGNTKLIRQSLETARAELNGSSQE